MDKRQFEKELDMKLASLKAEMMQKFEEGQKDEFPKIGDEYWFIADDGVVGNDTWEDDDIDKDRLSIGNISSTEEEMKFKRERLKVIAELEKYAEKDRKWDEGNLHFYIIWNYERNKIDYHSNSLFKHVDIYFESEEKAKQAVEEVGVGRVKRYYLRVEE